MLSTPVVTAAAAGCHQSRHPSDQGCRSPSGPLLAPAARQLVPLLTHRHICTVQPEQAVVYRTERLASKKTVDITPDRMPEEPEGKAVCLDRGLPSGACMRKLSCCLFCYTQCCCLFCYTRTHTHTHAHTHRQATAVCTCLGPRRAKIEPGCCCGPDMPLSSRSA